MRDYEVAKQIDPENPGMRVFWNVWCRRDSGVQYCVWCEAAADSLGHSLDRPLARADMYFDGFSDWF